MQLLFLCVALAAVLGVALRPDINRWRQQRRRDKKGAAELAAWKAEFDAENPKGPPWTREEIDAFAAWRASLALPAVELAPAPGREVTAAGTRLGGPVWLAPGEAWPAAPDGMPLEFVAQLDFAELPPLPDFPESGLLQFFVGRDDLHGANFDDLAAGAARVFWRPDGAAGLVPVETPLLRDDYEKFGQATEGTPFLDLAARAAGMPLVGRPAVQQPTGTDWRIYERLNGQLNRPGFKEVDDLVFDAPGGPDLVHHVGGQPVFVQNDVRDDVRYEGYDRVLLRLTSDHILMWGDVGEADFLISRTDLLARNFSRVVFTWDCS